VAIYDFSKAELKVPTVAEPVTESSSISVKDRLFSTTATRLFFVLLLLADALWVCYAVAQIVFCVLAFSITAGKKGKEGMERAWLNLQRSLVCGVSLFLALFSPAFGIMIACTYFLMYDKTGIEEVVPSSLRSQFTEFLPKEDTISGK